jgi:hypothetical protein
MARAIELGAKAVLRKPYSSQWLEAVVGEASAGFRLPLDTRLAF